MNVEFTKQAIKELSKLEKPIQVRIASAIRKIEADKILPQKLTNIQEWKIRSGDYRIILEVFFDEDKAYVLRIQHRREVYR